MFKDDEVPTSIGIAALIGTWQHTSPWDSDDYLAEYSVSYKGGAFFVSGKDLQDGEQFVISDITWDGEALRFRSLMPSTQREGLNEFRALSAGAIEAKFTFTTVETMRRAKT